MTEIFNPAAITRNHDRSRLNFGRYDFLHQRVMMDIIDRIRLVRRSFPRILFIGRSELTPLLRDAGYPNISAIGHMDEYHDQTAYDLILNVMTLHTENDVPASLIRMRQALRPDGLFLAGLIGGHTLQELRHALGTAEIELTGGFSPRVAPMIHLQDMAGLMQRAGFSLPVVDSETITVTYTNPTFLLHDLRGMGEGNPFPPSARQWMGRKILARMTEIYREHYGEPGGLIPATFDILYACGWSPHESQPQPLRPGSATHHLADVLATQDVTSHEKTPG